MSQPIAQQEARQIIEALCQRFGFSESVFDDHALYQGSKGKVYLRNAHAPDISGAAVVGLHIATVSKALKPSTNFIQTFGAHFCKNVIQVSCAETKELIAGQEIIPSTTIPDDVSDGYVALSYDGQPFMCGFLKDGELRNLLPKSRRRVLQFV